MCLKIWSDKSYLRSLQDVRPILMPFFGQIKKDEPHKNRFDNWVKSGKNIFSLTDFMEHADVVIYPQDPTIDTNGFKKFQDITKPKTLFVFFNSDFDGPISVRNNTILFRTSVLKSKKKSYEFGLPGWNEDWGFLGNRPLLQRPIVGFCGQDFKPSVRPNSLNLLERCEHIKTNFIRKTNFWGGWIDQGRKLDHGIKLRNEFIDNMRSCDYAFCARGGGNFSYRLYETMMSGRIPLLVDTDCLLPYDFIIDWGNYFPIVKENNLNSLPQVLLNFHKKFKSTEDFNNHQKLIRKMWEEYISPIGFFSNIHKHIKEL